MDSVISILIAVIAIAGVIILLMQISHKKTSSSAAPVNRQKGRQAIIRDATRKLSQDAHNPAALNSLSTLYFEEHLWDKAFPLFETMTRIAPAHPAINEGQARLRLGICQLKLERIEDAVQTLKDAYRFQRENPEANFYLGKALYESRDYENASLYFKRTLTLQRDYPGLNKGLGLSLYYSKHYRDSLPYLKRALDEDPENKEYLYAMADAMLNANMGDKAIRIFMHLRADPEYGARACLAAGNFHFNMNQLDKAEQDYEIGLKHKNIQPDVRNEMVYRLASSHLKQNNISKGLELLRELNAIAPGYKDTGALVARYAELNQNKNLQLYLFAGSSDFVAMCRQIATVYFKITDRSASVKMLDVSVSADYTELQTDVETSKWESSVLFRFYRMTGVLGELYIRDFHGKLQDLKIDKGICITAGTYSDEARLYTEGRPIDIIDKTKLIQLLKKVNIGK